MAVPHSIAAVDYNTRYLKTPAGILRIVEGICAVASIISAAEGSIPCDVGWNYGFFILVSVFSLIQSILVLILIVMRFDKKITFINVPLTLLLNDSIRILVYFLATVMMMMSIGRCLELIGSRIVATLLGIGGILILVGLSYTDYKWWKGEETPDSTETKEPNGIPVTESSPTVLTLS